MSTAAHVLATSAFARPQYTPKPHPQRPTEPRRPSPTQGRALEILNHAIEYLVDSRLQETWDQPSDAEAVHTLMASSRAVFMDCEVILNWRQRLQRVTRRKLTPIAGNTR